MITGNLSPFVRALTLVLLKPDTIERGLIGFITEFEYGHYAIDEADPLAKIAVEIDGCYWHGCVRCDFEGDKRIKLIDKKKTTYLKNRGWVIIRIKEHEIKKDPYTCIEMLRNLQEKRRKAHKDHGLCRLIFRKLILYTVHQSLPTRFDDVFRNTDGGPNFVRIP